MEKIKTFFKVVLVIVFLMQTTQAQETAKGIKDAGVKTHQHKNGCCQYKVIYLGGVFNNPLVNSSQKLFGNYSGKTVGFTMDYSQTIIRKSGFSIGFNLGGNYFTGNGDPFGSALPEPYLVTAQISSEVSGTSNAKNSGYFFGVGPQLNIHIANRFVFSPIFQVGYLDVTQSNFKATQTVLMQGFALPNYTKTYDLISQTETKTSGLGFIPKARLSYMISKNIGIWAEASYLLGPTVKSEITTFKPNTQPNSPPPSSYSIGQMDDGTYTTVSNDSKYNSIGFGGGLVYSFGGSTDRNIHNYPRGGHAIVDTPSTEKIDKINTESEIFTSNLIKPENGKILNCIKILSPSNGSNQNSNEDVKIRLSNEGLKKANVELKIYKISNDKNFWNKAENRKEMLDTQNTVYLSGNLEKESIETGFKPISLDAKQSGTVIESNIDKDKLTEGAYKMLVISNCGVTSSNFMVSTSALTTISLTTNCKEKFGDYSYTFSVKNTGSTPINVTNIPNFTSSTGIISGFSVTPTLPIVIPTGGTQNFTGSFTYSGTYTGDVYANVSGHQVGNVNLTSQDTEQGELKSCICDFCEKVLEFDYNQSPNATYSATSNSLSIHQDWWNMNTSAVTVAGAKAEIVSFERQVSDDCMKCDKNSNQWGNFISGHSGTTNGSFGNATGSVAGNTHHTLYFTNSNSYSFDTNISLPPLSTLACCCEKIKLKIRYTYIFKDKNGECKMCSAVFEYLYQRGDCPQKNPSDPKDISTGNINYVK